MRAPTRGCTYIQSRYFPQLKKSVCQKKAETLRAGLEKPEKLRVNAAHYIGEVLFLFRKIAGIHIYH